MSKVMALNSVRDTTLWKRLENGFNRKDELRPLVTKLLSTVEELCEEATERIKTMPTFHPEFTLHDETHLLRVTELMGKVLGKSLKGLNSVELALLILAAHFHDQGMVVDADKVDEMKESPEYKIHCDTWAINHPNLRQIEQQLQSPSISTQERKHISLKLADLQHAMIASYVRGTHGSFSGELVREMYGNDKRLEVVGVNLADMLARLCESHVLSAEEIKTLQCDELVGTHSVNLRYLSVILRLADILDFDRDRTPDVLYRTIHFTNEVSVAQWEKHRAVQGWVIKPELIRFDMKFEYPVYERAAREFMDQIDMELVSANEIVRSMPGDFGKAYKLDLPERVDRSRIGPKGNCYVYYNLEFSLSRDEVVKLLMGEKLYSSPSLCVRELLQNSLDALRYRKALYQTGAMEWKEGRVELEHGLDGDGYETLTCRDNGAGMDEMIVTQFLTNVGRSFYRSPYFEIERARFKQAGVDFDPCSQFGIGLMSCFMLGDRIKIESRRDYGPGRQFGKPLIVEVNGLGGMLVIREGKKAQPIGTTVSITLREKQAFMDEWSDKVRLMRILNGYALAVEFPIKATCEVPGIKGEFTIKPGIEYWPTVLEKAKIKRQITIEREFTDIDQQLKGALRESFLLDNRGLPTMENEEAAWELPTEKERWSMLVVKKSGEKYERGFTGTEGQTCLDGILVCGPPGRGARDEMLGCYRNLVGVGSLFTLDVRGDLKPEITAGRTPPKYASLWNIEPTWERLQELLYHAEGKLWEQVSEFLEKDLSHSEFWKLGVVYNARFTTMRAGVIWERMGLPVVDPNGNCEWRGLGDIKEAVPEAVSDGYELVALDGAQIRPPEEIIERVDKQCRDELVFRVRALAILMSTLRIHEGRVRLEFQPPRESSKLAIEFMLRSGPFVTAFVIPYDSEKGELLTVECPINTVNRNHPLVQLALESRFFENKDSVQEFATSAVACLADKDALEKISRDKAVPTRWMKMIAYRYLAVDWSRYAKNLGPPYRIWLDKKGIVEVTEENFHRWVKTDVK